MTITEFAGEIAKMNTGRKDVTVVQVSEDLKNINKLLWGIPYVLIKLRKKR